MTAVRRLLPAAFWAAMLFGFVMAILPKPPTLPGDPSDKVQHILAFLVLAALARLAYSRVRPVKIGLGLAAYGALIEFTQMIPALHRDAELLDWIADVCAASIVLILFSAARRLRSRR
jgi:VanZ family protein